MEINISDIGENALPSKVDSDAKKEDIIWDNYEKALKEQHHKFTLELNHRLFQMACFSI